MKGKPKTERKYLWYTYLYKELYQPTQGGKKTILKGKRSEQTLHQRDKCRTNKDIKVSSTSLTIKKIKTQLHIIVHPKEWLNLEILIMSSTGRDVKEQGLIHCS